MRIPITQETYTEGIPVNIKRPDGTTRAVTQDGYVDQCDHDNYTEEEGENWVVCDTCGEVGAVVQDISDDRSPTPLAWPTMLRKVRRLVPSIPSPTPVRRRSGCWQRVPAWCCRMAWMVPAGIGAMVRMIPPGPPEDDE